MKKPLHFALAAASYIVILVGGATLTQGLIPAQDNIIMPMAMLALLVFSAALMGFLFLSEPLKMLFAGDKQGATKFFLQTLGIFACFVVIFLILILVV